MALLECTATQLHTEQRLSGLMMLMIGMVVMAVMILDHPALLQQALQKESKSKTTK